MIKVTKIGDTNCNSDLNCEFCGNLIPLGLPFYSVILPIHDNPPRNYIACKECADKYEKIEN